MARKPTPRTGKTVEALRHRREVCSMLGAIAWARGRVLSTRPAPRCPERREREDLAGGR